jgi:hypothetical protein
MTTVNANVVIVDQTHKIDPALLHNAALALNTQVTQHLPKYWSGIDASVSSAPSLHALPAGSWPVFLVESLPPGEGGFHLDKKNQPYAKVIASADDASWTIDASHEILEMLVDPYGNRMQSSQAIAIKGDGVVDAPGTFDYLVEACDPCEANNFGYEISGIAVSDFITPNFYDTTSGAGVIFSFMGNIKRPRELLVGGYISYTNADGNWQQILWVDPGPPTLNNLSMDAGVRSLREAVHTAMGPDLTKAKHQQRRKAGGLSAHVEARVREYLDRDSARREKMFASRYQLE